MTYVLLFMIGLAGGSATFASQELCEAAGVRMLQEFAPLPGMLTSSGPRITYFCIKSGFKVP